MLPRRVKGAACPNMRHGSGVLQLRLTRRHQQNCTRQTSTHYQWISPPGTVQDAVAAMASGLGGTQPAPLVAVLVSGDMD